jgi:molybdate transport system substrate-binding protein
MRFHWRAPVRAAAAFVVVSVGVPACGPGGSTRESESPAFITVFAASSLSTVFPQIAREFSVANPREAVRFSFGGTDSLAAQIGQGAPADVFAGASATYGDRLWAARLIDRPKPFCTNSLVIVVPASNPASLDSPRDLARQGVKVLIGAAAVPIGTYTRQVLTNLGAEYGEGYDQRVLANVVSEEDTAEGIVSKISQGEADAGFVYRTDQWADAANLHSIPIDAAANVFATYSIAAIVGGTRTLEARAFVGFVLSSPGQRLLRAAGFGPPPE